MHWAGGAHQDVCHNGEDQSLSLQGLLLLLLLLLLQHLPPLPLLPSSRLCRLCLRRLCRQLHDMAAHSLCQSAHKGSQL